MCDVKEELVDLSEAVEEEAGEEAAAGAQDLESEWTAQDGQYGRRMSTLGPRQPQGYELQSVQRGHFARDAATQPIGRCSRRPRRLRGLRGQSGRARTDPSIETSAHMAVGRQDRLS